MVFFPKPQLLIKKERSSQLNSWKSEVLCSQSWLRKLVAIGGTVDAHWFSGRP